MPNVEYRMSFQRAFRHPSFGLRHFLVIMISSLVIQNPNPQSAIRNPHF
jgi:hypothetical protein